MTIKVLAFKGKSWVSKAIRFQTRSEYSHIGIELPDQTVIEAWHKGGVRRIADVTDGHTSGTKIDIYHMYDRYLEHFDEDRCIQFLEEQVGQPYDFGAIARFLTRKPHAVNKKWFCSELCAEAFRVAGVDLLVGAAWNFSPRDIAMSPMLIKMGSWTVQ